MWGVDSELNREFSPDWSISWLGAYREFTRDNGEVTVRRSRRTGNKHRDRGSFYYFHERYCIDYLLYGSAQSTVAGLLGLLRFVFCSPQLATLRRPCRTAAGCGSALLSGSA